MFCHRCNAQNLDSSLNCAQCGASLLGKSVSDPETFAKNTRDDDNKIYGRTWATVFTLAYFLIAAMAIPELREDKTVFWLGSLVPIAIGHWFGRAVARAHNGGY